MSKKLILLGFLVLLTAAAGVSAQEMEMEASPEAAATTESEYRLPYPGMLPDNRLYKLKTLRDKIVLFLIRDPYKKAEKRLNLADRMLFESLKLAEKDEDKIDLAIHNAFKGEHHMTRFVDLFKRAVYSGRDFNTELAGRAHEAAKAHQGLLQGIKSRAETDEQDEKLDQIAEFSQRNDAELFKLRREATASPELVQ